MASCKACGYDKSLSVIKSYELTIAGRLPSQNRLRPRFNSYAKNRYAVALLKQGRPYVTGRKRRVWITRLFGKRGRSYDIGNLVGGAKPLIDALVTTGWLVDDSPKWLECHYSQHRSDTDRHLIRIVIEDVSWKE